MTSVWSGWILNRYTFSLPIFELIVWPLSHTVYYTLRANCPQYYYNETDGTVFPATAQTRILSIKYWRTEVGDIYYPAIVCCYCSQSRLPLTIILSISISPTSTHYTVYVEEERLDFCLLFPAEQYTYNRLFSIPVSHRWVVLVPSHLRTLQQLITVLIVQKWLFLGSKAKPTRSIPTAITNIIKHVKLRWTQLLYRAFAFMLTLFFASEDEEVNALKKHVSGRVQHLVGLFGKKPNTQSERQTSDPSKGKYSSLLFIPQHHW